MLCSLTLFLKRFRFSLRDNFQMGFFDAPAFTTLLSFLSSLCTQSVHIAIVLNNVIIKVYGDPREGSRDGGGSGKGQEEDWGTLAPVPR